MSYQLSPPTVSKFFDNNGNPLSNGQVYTYAAGTTTPQASYPSANSSVPNPNPVILNFRGEASIWLDPSLTYKINLADSQGNQIPGWPVDNISGGIYAPSASIIPTVSNTFTLGSPLYSWAQLYLGPDAAPVFDISTGNIGYWAQTTAEQNAGIVPTRYSYQSGPYRYGATGNEIANDSPAWNAVGLVGGYQFAEDGNFLITSRVTLNSYVTVEGSDRQNCVLVAASALADYMVVCGANSPDTSTEVGEISRIKFSANTNTMGCLYMANEANMWRLDSIVFTGPCPGLILNNVWDSNYTNLDFISCTPVSGSNPATGATVIITNGSNNLYLRGLRIESSTVGAIYVDATSGPIHVDTGKIDNHYNTQNCAGITVAASGVNSGALWIDQFEITGIYGQYPLSVQGFLKLGKNVVVDGSSNMPAAIEDTRAWAHLDDSTLVGTQATSFGPIIPPLELGFAYFRRTNYAINATTPAALYSQIYPIRSVNKLTISANGTVSGNTITVQTNVTAAANDLYDGMYLVHNPTGFQSNGEAGARRKILISYTNGQMQIQGTWDCTLDSEWSIEYCGQHATPYLSADGITLAQGMTLFAVIATGCTIGTPAYVSTNGNNLGGTTEFTISGTGLSASQVLTGFFLIDEVSGEPFYINYGMDASSNIGIMYNRTSTLNSNDTFSVVAGYYANVRENGSSWDWSYAGKKLTVLKSAAVAAGFDIANLPLWESALTGDPIILTYASTVTWDASAGSEFILSVSNSSNFTIGSPYNARNGQRVLFSVKNNAGGSLGTITWPGNFKMATWTNPTSGNGYTLDLFYDGADWRQIGTAALVPN